MKQLIAGIISVFLIIFTAGCGEDEVSVIKRTAEYGEKTVKVELPIKLNIDCFCSNIEIYCWNKQEVKFEYTKSITAKMQEQKLKKYLQKMDIITDVSGSEVSFKSNCEESDKVSRVLELSIYIPYRTEEVSISCREGKLKICDHLKCNLSVEGGILDTIINKFSGRVNASVKKGNVRINAGKLLDGTVISTIDGNVYVKALYEPSGEYSFYSENGVLDINIPKELNAKIIDYLPADYYDNNTKEGFTIDTTETDTASFRLTSGVEGINVNRF